MKREKINLSYKNKIIFAVTVAVFIIFAASFIVFKIATAPQPEKTIANAAKITQSAETTDAESKGENDSENKEIKIEKFVDKDKLCFKEDEYKAEVFTEITVELEIQDKSVIPSTLEWSLGDEKDGKIESTNGSTAKIKLNRAGDIEVTALAPTGLYAVCKINSTAPSAYQVDNVPFITQNAQYPSGCEAISATMLLNYYNYDITPGTFIDGYLHMDYLRESSDGTAVVGPDPYTAFIGSPYDENSLGCYPPVIVEALNKVFDETGSDNEAVNTTGKSLEQLAEEYLIQDEPVLVWATMYLWEPFETDSWIVEGASEESPYKDGDVYSWIANEHCLVFTGYDEYYYYFNDPLYYNETISYEKTAFNERFEQIGKCSVAITGGVLEKNREVDTP